MIDFKNFKIKRGPSKDLHDPRLIVEEGYWYLSTDKAELFIGIVENGAPVLKPINGELIPEVNLEGYATEDFVREAIASIEIPEVELYDDTELRNLVNSKADKEHTHEEYSLIDHKHDEYLTAHQDISHLATKEELPNLDGYAKLENIPDVSKFITEIPSDYITENELENKGYLTEHQSLAGYATESYVLAEIAKAALEGNDIDLSTYATKEFVAEEINKIEVPEAYDDAELRTLINGKAESDHTHEEYSLVDHKHTEYLTEHQDLSHLALKEHEHSEYITEHQSLEHLALKEHKHDEYLTEHQSLEGYAKTADLFSKDYNDLTNKPEIPSIEGLASETYVQTEIGKIKFPETDLSNYYTKEEVDALLPVEELEEVKTKVETVLLPKVEEEIEPTVAELKAWVDANNEIQDVILAKVGEDLNILENNIGYVKVDDRSFAEVIDETFAKKSEIPSLEEYAKLEDVPSVEGLATEDFVKEEINKIEHPTIAVLKDLQIGETFITDITVGHLEAGTEIKADMTFGALLKAILGDACVHDWLEATCTEPKTCKLCGKTEGEALGHDYVSEITKPATCSEEGIRTFTCNRCGDSYTETIPVLEHQTAIRVENNIAPTCEIDGSYTNVKYCIICGEEISRETVVVPALGHDLGDWEIVSTPQVGVPGLKQRKCSRCDYVETEEIPALEPEQPEVPEGILGEIISNDLQMYVVNNDGSLESVPFEVNELSEEQAAQEPAKSGFFQVITNEGNTLEYGYNDLSIDNQDWVYMVALPKSIKEENISVQTFSDEEQIWEDNTFELTCDVDTVNDICDIYGMDISSVDIDKYTVWASVSEQLCTGSKIRYVITE